MADSTVRTRGASGASGATSRRTRYENELYTWVGEQAALLKARRLDEIDADNMRAVRETDIARAALPATCPYDWDEITARPFDWDEAI